MTDVDDNKPEFIKVPGREVIEFRLEEEAAPGTVVGTVTASDADEGLNSVMGYEIIAGNDAGLFEVVAMPSGEGEIRVKVNYLFKCPKR